MDIEAPFVLLALRLYGALVRLDYPSAYGESHTVPGLLGGESGGEDSFQLFSGHPFSGITDPYLQGLTLRPALGADGYLASLASPLSHRVSSIIQEIVKHLLNLTGIHREVRKVRFQLGAETDVLEDTLRLHKG